jgi:hypothetical protein
VLWPVPMPRLALIVLVCASIPAAPAAATLLGGGGSGALLSGTAIVAECDEALTVTYETQGGLVTSVVVGGIADPECSGGRVSVTLTAASVGVASGGPATVPTDGDSNDDSVTVAVAPGAPASQVDRTDVLIEDPS